ncbi:hypothetical protein BKA61DRAFT_567551 [Leptodontidium sp. MPI-SDFR-AT-0119]|nr:hypothetical protein BKA61DRAFT_567551 [Leptodontidium sp. MPI-SDFR-AT-0119]
MPAAISSLSNQAKQSSNTTHSKPILACLGEPIKNHASKARVRCQSTVKELEVEFAQKSQENSKKATASEAEQGRLLTVTKQQQRMIKARVEELEKLKKQYDILDRVTNSFKSEREDLEKELGTMKKDFALDTKPAGYL